MQTTSAQMQAKLITIDHRVKIKGHKQEENYEYSVWDKASLILFVSFFNNPENIGCGVITCWLSSGETNPSGTTLVQPVSLATF